VIAVGSLIKWARAKGAQDELSASPAPPVNVRVWRVQGVELKDKITLPGSVEPLHDVVLSAEVVGVVLERKVEEGAQVEGGELILQLEPDNYRDRLKQARANYELAKLSYKRVKELASDGTVSPAELDAARAQFESAEAALSEAETALRKTSIRAPFSGVLNRWFVEEGEFVGVGDPLAQLVDVSRVRVTVHIPEKDVVFTSEGAPVEAYVNSFPEKRFRSSLYYVSRTADETTRTYEAKFELDNSSGLLKGGMILNVELQKRVIRDAIMVPLYVVITGNGRYVVFVEEDGVARRREVEIGLITRTMVQLLAGVAPGERLIVDGHRELTDGQAVRVVEEVQSLGVGAG